MVLARGAIGNDLCRFFRPDQKPSILRYPNLSRFAVITVTSKDAAHGEH